MSTNKTAKLVLGVPSVTKEVANVVCLKDNRILESDQWIYLWSRAKRLPSKSRDCVEEFLIRSIETEPLPFRQALAIFNRGFTTTRHKDGKAVCLKARPFAKLFAMGFDPNLGDGATFTGLKLMKKAAERCQVDSPKLRWCQCTYKHAVDFAFKDYEDWEIPTPKHRRYLKMLFGSEVARLPVGSVKEHLYLY